MSIVHYHDLGTMKTLLDRLNRQRLPLALALKEKVEHGERLSDLELGYLQQVFEEAEHARSLFLRHPEVHPLLVKLVRLYGGIVEKALENERAQEQKSGKSDYH